MRTGKRKGLICVLDYWVLRALPFLNRSHVHMHTCIEPHYNALEVVQDRLLTDFRSLASAIGRGKSFSFNISSQQVSNTG